MSNALVESVIRRVLKEFADSAFGGDDGEERPEGPDDDSQVIAMLIKSDPHLVWAVAWGAASSDLTAADIKHMTPEEVDFMAQEIHPWIEQDYPIEMIADVLTKVSAHPVAKPQFATYMQTLIYTADDY